MKRFILLTFGFLGWAFYEMSGGADFEPASAQRAAASPAPQSIETAEPTPKVASLAPQAVEQKLAKIVPVDTTPPGFEGAETIAVAKTEEVSRVSVSLTTVENAVIQAEAPLVNDVSLVPVNAGSLISSQDTPAIIPSLITPDDTGAATINASGSGDLRSVAGNSVNVRGGPGTEYGIVSRLTRGETVEIISDDGSGWVQMRPLNGGPEGWMADFLLTDS
ncbi:SH3 domain-containing protein [uncultured Sulfitobacter sp.]|jgi:hypothetical protein|uniref:SH3 domain-containing protein n=1 Tax=Sulfitobacter sp. SH22 TaxID=3421172 RepID=UPI0025E14086|nr:SH3 domain-containing protein [uncultured Sulfitobacter sp.]